MTNDPRILVLAFIGGTIPSLLWLWFWTKEEEKKPEPKGILTAVFILGMLAVIFVLPIEKFIQSNVASPELQFILWASAEEVIKYLAVMIVLFRTSYASAPIDCPIYLIAAAVGFAALENALFLIKPLSIGATTVGLLTGQLRFLGATLLHAVASGIVGVAIGLSMRMRVFKRKFYLLAGLILATTLHSVFNFFIIQTNRNTEGYFLEVLKVFSFLWVVTIILMLLFEKVRRMN
ncbi:MAG: hypothetical protein UU66_C0027G0002 [Parcubacteria group bacterium GW2011_GWB1_41_5]|nr:MAG: hypothetical protein UU66_C0027G0002 [Parcubacteria group bacterium GW2011_GWB1_41_5]